MNNNRRHSLKVFETAFTAGWSLLVSWLLWTVTHDGVPTSSWPSK